MRITQSMRQRKRRNMLRQLMFGSPRSRLGQSLRFETLEARTLLAGDLESSLSPFSDVAADSAAVERDPVLLEYFTST